MSLTTCQECEKQVSELAALCPHCGAPVQKRSEQDAEYSTSGSEGLGTAAFVVALVGLFLFFIPVLGVLLSVIAIILACRQAKVRKTGLATAGKIIGIVGIVPSVSALLLCGSMGLGALAIPKFNDVSESAKMNACRANMRTIASQEVIYYASNRRYTTSYDNLNLTGVVCPACEKPFVLEVYDNGDAFKVVCPNYPSHGLIDNGIASWIN